VLIETALALSALLLYRKTGLRALVYCAASIWLTYFWKPFAVLLAFSLFLLLRESGKTGKKKAAGNS
jgi:hypothetical protein